MAVVTQNQLRSFQRLNKALEQQIWNELSNIWEAVSHLGNDQIKAVLVDAVPDLIDKYGSMSAVVAAEWFEDLIGSVAVVPDLYDPDTYRASTRWAISPLYREDRSPSDAFSHLVAASNRHMKAYGRGVIDESVSRTPNVYYARVPTGPTTCEFCLVMASRGPVYKTKGTATYAAKDGGKYHDDCDCLAVPMRGRWSPDPSSPREWRWEGDSVAGYRFDQLYAENYKPFWREQDEITDVVRRMRAARK